MSASRAFYCTRSLDLTSTVNTDFLGKLAKISSQFRWLIVSAIILHLSPLLSASFDCYLTCNCVYTRNKLQADCGSLQLTDLPQASVEHEKFMTDIQVINLSRNNFSELKKEIFYSVHLINLQRIYLRKASIENIHKNAFYKLIQLVELDLAYNYMKKVPSESFQHIPKLKTLDLSNNQIEIIEANSFHFLNSLKLLHLDSNRIKKIDTKGFMGLWNLGELRLSDNQLTFVSSKSLMPLNSTHSLYLAGNSWHCDCKLREMRQTLLTMETIVPDEPRCANSGKVWTKLGLDSLVCPPKIAPNRSNLQYQVEQYSNLSLKCSFYMDDSQPLTIKWFWQNRPITNNSEGIIPNQHFSIKEWNDYDTFDETGKRQKLRTSKLDITFVLKLNEGIYSCSAKNDAGLAERNFTVEVTAFLGHRMVHDSDSPAAEASRESILSNLHDKNIDHEVGTADSVTKTAGNTTIYGMILGVIFGMFITALLFGAVIIIFCRKRSNPHRNTLGGSSRVVAAESELEKLTASTISGSTPSIQPMAPSSVTDMINPIRKPPRLGLTGTPLAAAGDHQIWMMKRTSFSLPHDQATYRSDGDGCYCDSSLPIYEYDCSTQFNQLTVNPQINEPDLIHQSNMERKRSKESDESLGLEAQAKGNSVSERPWLV